jgi:hypothetical protein
LIIGGPKIMARAAYDKLNNIIGNVEIAGEFGQWVTEQGNVQV